MDYADYIIAVEDLFFRNGRKYERGRAWESLEPNNSCGKKTVLQVLRAQLVRVATSKVFTLRDQSKALSQMPAE